MFLAQFEENATMMLLGVIYITCCRDLNRPALAQLMLLQQVTVLRCDIAHSYVTHPHQL